MALTQSQRSLIEKTRSVGAAREAQALSDNDCVFLVATIARDLGLLDHFRDLPSDFPSFFELAINDLLRSIPDVLPDMTLGMNNSSFFVRIGNEIFRIKRTRDEASDEGTTIPDDVNEQMPGV